MEMKTFWCVVQKYPDSGKVKAAMYSVCGQVKPEDKAFNGADCDKYYDYFDDKQEAKQFYDDCLKG